MKRLLNGLLDRQSLFIKVRWFCKNRNFATVENLQKIQNFRKITNFPVSTCKKILSKNDYDVDKSVDFIFENYKDNWELKKSELKEGYYCFKLEGDLIGLVELDCLSDLVSENILFKQLLVNMCNWLIEHNKKIILNKENLDRFIFLNYIRLFYEKDKKISIDTKLENGKDDIVLFKKLYFNRNVKQLINYTSMVLNEYLFLRKCFVLNFENIKTKENEFFIKSWYYHKGEKVGDFVFCKSFIFTFLLVESQQEVSEEAKHILEKFAQLLCVNVLMYKPKYFCNTSDFNLSPIFDQHFVNVISCDNKAQVNNNVIEETEREKEKGGEKENEDLLFKKIQAWHLFEDCLERLFSNKIKLPEKTDFRFVNLFSILEKVLHVKIRTRIVYADINNELVML